MRLMLSILVPPVAGLAAFGLLWVGPFLAGIRHLPADSYSLGALFAAWAIPVYPLVTVLHLPVFLAAWWWPRVAGPIQFLGMIGIYTGSFALIGVAWMGVSLLIGSWHQWVALGTASALHAGAFLNLRPAR
ncbi:hypothetical protein [Thiohalorhabdus methylotrophus]|uniref:DUF4175 domain-containing protein n=1 Tax=Thiohalorhabdus methylotrophus TaxID=3242694 RepID=A0ABV4TWY5_9GAMM